MTARCWNCGALITWVHTSDGRRLAIDSEPHPEGYVVVEPDGLAYRLTQKGAEYVGGWRHMPHAETCSKTNH